MIYGTHANTPYYFSPSSLKRRLLIPNLHPLLSIAFSTLSALQTNGKQGKQRNPSNVTSFDVDLLELCRQGKGLVLMVRMKCM